MMSPTLLPDASQPLGRDAAQAAIGALLDGAGDDAAITAFLGQIADRGAVPAEIVGAAQAMRARMRPIVAPAHAIDVCGTGGDGSHSLNVSTAVAIVVAACGVPVAKHGNRAASSQAGAADTLAAAGLDLDGNAARAAELLADLGIAFLFAPVHHPALGRLAPIRRAMARPTIFNLLGPLCNPARVTRQLIGVPRPALVPVYAAAAAELGYSRALIVSGAEGLDEISVAGPTDLAWIDGASVRFATVTPDAAGLDWHDAAALRGGDAAYNAAALHRLLDGEAGAYRDAVLLNAAGALLLCGQVSDWRDGVEEAAEAIDRGLARALLACWIATSRGVAT